jgi:hypothetical protein
LTNLIPLALGLTIPKPANFLEFIQREYVLVGIVADHEFKEFLLEARIIVGQGIGLAEETDQAQNVLGRIGESEIMQFFKVDLSFIKDIHFYVDQIAEIHLLVHCIQNRIYN